MNTTTELDDLVHPLDAVDWLPVNPRSRRRYSGAVIYKWFREGRLSFVEVDGTKMIRRADLMTLAVELSGTGAQT